MIDHISIAMISIAFMKVLVAIMLVNVVQNAMKSLVNTFNQVVVNLSRFNRLIHQLFIFFQLLSMFSHMDKVHFDYDIDMVDRIYIDNGMHMVYHNQSSKIDQMEQ